MPGVVCKPPFSDRFDMTPKTAEETLRIVIKETVKDILPFLADVSAGADTAKEALGFWPSSSYHSFAASGKLLVAVVKTHNAELYAGHIMFGGLFPQAKIFQLFVVPSFRGHGIGSQLVKCLIQQLTARYWLIIVANVADDLAANSAWERMGFNLVRTKAGGASRRRRINVRVLDLETPSLLTMMTAPAKPGELRFAERYNQRPIYLFDLNVLFDVVRERPRSEAAAAVVWAGMANQIRLMVASEFANELLRTARDPDNDPVLAFARRAESLPAPSQDVLRLLVKSLGPIVFPERHHQDKLSAQDRSDLRHIATAIHHKAAGFITSENAILRARPQLLEQWGLDVIGVEEFRELVSQRSVEAYASAEFSKGILHTFRNRQSDLPRAEAFLRAMDTSTSFVADALSCHCSHTSWILVTDDRNVPLGFAKWSVHGGTKRMADVSLVVDEENSAFEPIIDHLLDFIPRELVSASPTLVRLHLAPGQIRTRQSALSKGFHPPLGSDNKHGALQRLALGKVITPKNWAIVRRSLMSVASLELPRHMPTMDQVNAQMTLVAGDHRVNLSLPELESALAPVLFLFSGRGGVIVPIRSHFARDLIGADPQLSLFAPREAILRDERIYISAPKTVRLMQPGRLMLFYESRRSGGRGCVFAVARITSSRVIAKSEALMKVQSRGVLDYRSLEDRSVSDKVAETSFDNIFVFGHPVSLQRLRELGCVDRGNLRSAQAVTSERLLSVVAEGRLDG